ncbi:UDP-N-acetylmuramoyl-L-alanine--D-glutamate ligase [Corynebacterium sp. sy017]|nr:UDP-N-acetylmuramoyl-L-alanine--D-glutamate ligase [Corynebacterium sp. sy017]TSD92493.1 UDP-N-acetylmuramoyl-L-alanine--D-glutamate ligase [Corynebacterium sp. SY003]
MTSQTQLPGYLRGTVLVAGAGVTGIGTVKLLHHLGIAVELVDAHAQSLANAQEQTGVVIRSLEEAMDRIGTYSLVVTSPGWRPDTPLLCAALEKGCEVIGDVELCYRLDQAQMCGKTRTWVVITGSNGKTTTTAMTTAMLQAAGLAAQAVGNIGVSVAQALMDEQRSDIFVAELSSFQLHWTKELVPDIGVLLNIAEDHLDWHGDFAAYKKAKAKVLAAPVVIVGCDDTHVQEAMEDYQRTYVCAENESKSQTIIPFRNSSPKSGEFGVHEGQFYDHAIHNMPEGSPVAGTAHIEPPGLAGIYDALAAIAVACALDCSHEAIRQALGSFQVAPHRGQIVARWPSHADLTGQIVAIDNSKATNPHAADTALSGYDSIIWVAGGQLKGADVNAIVEKYATKLKAVALLGQDREIIAQAVREKAPHALLMMTESRDPQIAMAEVVAWSIAQANAGDAIILAPAAASLDMYSGMAERGTMFAQAIATYT